MRWLRKSARITRRACKLTSWARQTPEMRSAHEGTSRSPRAMAIRGQGPWVQTTPLHDTERTRPASPTFRYASQLITCGYTNLRARKHTPADMDRTSGKPNPMKPGGATDPLEDVQGPKKPARPSDPKVRETSPHFPSFPSQGPTFFNPLPLLLSHSTGRGQKKRLMNWGLGGWGGGKEKKIDTALTWQPGVRHRAPRGGDGRRRAGRALRQHGGAAQCGDGPAARLGPRPDAARHEAQRGAEVRFGGAVVQGALRHTCSKHS